MASLKEQSEELFNLGLQYSENGQFEDAIKCYDKVINLTIDKRPTFSSSSPFPSREDMAELKEFLEKEMKEREKELELNPNLVMAYFNRGKCKQELEDYESALSDYSEAINLNKNFAMAYVARGKCQQELKDYDSALYNYDEVIRLANDSGAIELNLDFFDIYYNIGICCEEYEEEYSLPSFEYELYGCRDSYREPWEFSNLDMLYQVKYHNSRCEMLERAVAEYSKAIELNPSFADAYNKRGNCYIKLDRLKYHHIELNRELVLSDYNEAIKLNPSYAEAYNNRGIYYQYLGEYKRALDDYDKAIEYNHNYIEAYLHRGACYASMPDEELASMPDEELIIFPSIEPSLFSKDIFISNYFRKIFRDLNLSSKRTEEDCTYAISFVAQKQYIYAKELIDVIFQNAPLKEQHHKAVYLKNIKNAEELDIKNQDLEKLNAELEEKNKQLESEIKQKKSLQNRMQKLVEQFTHSLGNVIFPDTIYQVAERLKNNPECRKDVLLLNEAYHSEIIIKLQGELLRQRYANTNPEKFRQFIRSCRRLPNNSDNTKSIEDILDYAASRVTARFLNQHYAGLNTIRDKVLAKKGVDIDALKQKFEDDILLNKSLRPIAWINKNLRPVQITEISPLWKKVCILAESHAEALLFGYFSEILFNAFKYADHDKDEFLTLVFNESVINDKTYLACSWKNPVKDKTPLLGTGKGLDAIQEDLKQLNDTENPEQSLLVQQQNNQFQVTLFFDKDLLIDDLPILTRKRKTIEANHA